MTIRRREFVAGTSTLLVAACGGGGGGGGTQAPLWVTSTLAGSPSMTGSANGTGTGATFSSPAGIAVDASGNVYVADTGNHLIRKINPSGVVSTWAGSGTAGAINGTGTGATFSSPAGVAVDASGNVYVADTGNHLIRKINLSGVVSTWAGSGTSGVLDGASTGARFTSPKGVAVDASGNVYVADTGNDLLRQISLAAQVSDWLPPPAPSAEDPDPVGGANLYSPTGVGVDDSGQVVLADTENHRILRVPEQGVWSVLAGNAVDSTPSGSADGTGTAAGFNLPSAVDVDTSGNVYVADTGNHLIRMITPLGVVSTLAGSEQFAAGSANGYDRGATFSSPKGVAVDASGNVYVADTGNHLIRKIRRY